MLRNIRVSRWSWRKLEQINSATVIYMHDLYVRVLNLLATLFRDYAARYLSLSASVVLTLELLLPRLYNRAPRRMGEARLIFRVRPHTRWPTMNGYVSGAAELVTRYLPPRFTPCSLASGIIILENRLFPHRLLPRRRSSRLDIPPSRSVYYYIFSSSFSSGICMTFYKWFFFHALFLDVVDQIK